MAYSLVNLHRKQEIKTNASSALRRANINYLIIACLAGIVIGVLLLISPWLAFVVTLGVIVCIVALSRPVILCYLIIGAVALTSGMQRGLLIPLLKPNEVILFFSTGIALIIILAKKPNRLVNLRLITTAIIVLVGGTMLIPSISYLLRGTILTVQDWLTLLAPLQYILLFWLFAYLPSDNKERKRILQLMLLCGALVAIIGLMQGAKIGFVVDLLNQWFRSPHETEAASAGRVTSLMAAWNVLGIFMMFNLFIAWTFGISKPNYLGNWLTIIAIGFFSACLVVSGSYAGMIGLILGVSIISFLQKGINRRTIALFLGLAIVGTLVFILFKPLISERLNTQFGYGGVVPQTLVFRLKVWREIYLPAVQQNLLWGINPTVPSTYTWQYTESQYLSLLFSFGLVGFIAFFAWVGFTLAWLIRRFRHTSGLLNPISVIAITILLVLVGAGLTNAVFTYSGTADYLWIILGLLTANEEVRLQTALD